MKKYSLTVIRPSDVIEEQSLSMIKGGAAGWCFGKAECKLVVCSPNNTTPSLPTDSVPTKP